MKNKEFSKLQKKKIFKSASISRNTLKVTLAFKMKIKFNIFSETKKIIYF